MKYNLLYKISFIMYIPALFALPYMSARIWADMIGLLFAIALFYQLVYLFFLRKKEQLSFVTILGQFFLYSLLSLEMWVVLSCIDLAVNGCVPHDFLGNPIGERLYGWEAITEDGFGFYIYKTILIVCTVYQILYASLLLYKKRKNQ